MFHEKESYFFVFVLVFCLTAAVSADQNFDQQLGLIADHADLWKQEFDYIHWGYTVTDLDHNGRLEIISASLQGTGMYTYIQMFEVNEDGTGLEEVRQDRPAEDSAPDIMVDRVPVYHDPDSGADYYIFMDMIRNGFAELYENTRAVRLEDGVWKEEMLALKSTVYSDEEHFTETLTDADGNAITQEQYESIAENRFPAFERGEYCFVWNMTSVEDFNGLSGDALVESLSRCAVPVCPPVAE